MTTPLHMLVTLPDQRPGAPDERPRVAHRLPIIGSERRRSAGFTLIEMMCTVTVAGLLSSVAYPAYTGVLAKSRRADALAATMAVQAAEERYRSGSTSYGSLGQIGAPATSPAGHYALSVVNPSASGYTVLATAKGGQAVDGACRFLKLTADGANLSYGSGDSAATGNDAATNQRCWNL